MSNKLYTEEEIRESLLKHQNASMFMSVEQIDYLISELTPIELPTDEEIIKESDEFELNSRVSLGMHISFELGAKWMRDKIQGGNNEPK